MVTHPCASGGQHCSTQEGTAKALPPHLQLPLDSCEPSRWKVLPAGIAKVFCALICIVLFCFAYFCISPEGNAEKKCVSCEVENSVYELLLLNAACLLCSWRCWFDRGGFDYEGIYLWMFFFFLVSCWVSSKFSLSCLYSQLLSLLLKCRCRMWISSSIQLVMSLLLSCKLSDFSHFSLSAMLFDATALLSVNNLFIQRLKPEQVLSNQDSLFLLLSASLYEDLHSVPVLKETQRCVSRNHLSTA